uniref:NADH dehydrogenase [ubiquinone] 1 beta subcomplex subunit 10 n=1 Tax=Franklinothrips vespiformis TaxID=297892 RepID=A0A481SX55_FRAVS|nr:hypothetical protein [Franklinothrips vespiformis]
MADHSAFLKFVHALGAAIDGPVTWWKEQVVDPHQKNYNWYHRKYRRVPTVDQCYTDDPVCIFEADMQFLRDKNVDSEIISILRGRYEQCVVYEGPDATKCASLWETYEQAAANWFCKYGDLGAHAKSYDAFMKQKHRLIWERRYGPVGTGMNPSNQEA